MSECRRIESSMDRGEDPGALIDSLRARGADRFDPVRFRFIEALAGRALAHGDAAQRILGGKLAKALSEYGERFDQAQSRAKDALTRMAERFPHAADDLRRNYGAGDFSELHRRVADLENNACGTPLADLLGHIAQHASENADGRLADDVGENVGAYAELKSLRHSRSTWSKLSVEQQLAEALAQGPENAGPLNSHLLVLRSLKSMRDIAPDYLKRFMSYVDALLWLDQAGGGSPPMQKNVVRGESDKKRKPGRTRAV